MSARGTQPSLVEGETALETYDRLNMSTNVTIAAIVEHYRQLIADHDAPTDDEREALGKLAWEAVHEHGAFRRDFPDADFYAAVGERVAAGIAREPIATDERESLIAGRVTEEAVDAALHTWFKDTLERTPFWLADSVKASHRDRMRAALEAGARA